MRRSIVSRVLALVFVFGCYATAASATTIDLGILSFDADVLASGSFTFDITNLTGLNAFPPDFPIGTPLTITVTSLTASTSGGGALTLTGSDFTAVDSAGDVNCTVAGDAGSGACNFAAYLLTSATLTGTLSSTAGLVGLPPGFIGIESTFTATLTPSSGATLIAGFDAVPIEATLVPAAPISPVPEPSTWVLLDTGLLGLLAAYKRNWWFELPKRLGIARA
jgi:hypothetical protein